MSDQNSLRAVLDKAMGEGPEKLLICIDSRYIYLSNGSAFFPVIPLVWRNRVLITPILWDAKRIEQAADQVPNAKDDKFHYIYFDSYDQLETYLTYVNSRTVANLEKLFDIIETRFLAAHFGELPRRMHPVLSLGAWPGEGYSVYLTFPWEYSYEKCIKMSKDFMKNDIAVQRDEIMTKLAAVLENEKHEIKASIKSFLVLILDPSGSNQERALFKIPYRICRV